MLPSYRDAGNADGGKPFRRGKAPLKPFCSASLPPHKGSDFGVRLFLFASATPKLNDSGLPDARTLCTVVVAQPFPRSKCNTDYCHHANAARFFQSPTYGVYNTGAPDFGPRNEELRSGHGRARRPLLRPRHDRLLLADGKRHPLLLTVAAYEN